MQDSCFFLGHALPCLALYRLATQLQITKGELFGFFTEPILLQWFIICLVVPTAAISLPTLYSAKTYIPWTICVTSSSEHGKRSKERRQSSGQVAGQAVGGGQFSLGIWWNSIELYPYHRSRSGHGSCNRKYDV